MFTLTSGSTGQPKLIPITDDHAQQSSPTHPTVVLPRFIDHPDLFSGKMLGVVSPVVEGRTAGGIPFGAASGLIYQSSSALDSERLCTPYEIAEVKDFAAKYYLIMRLALEHDITFLGTPNPSTILRLVETRQPR